MPEILLTTLNARFAHCAFGLRYLHANIGDLRDRTEIVEFEISQRPTDIIESLLARRPRIIGIGVYIWNVTQTTQLVAELKRIQPELIIVLGGPEVSHETAEQPIAQLADYVITGEADLAFGDLCRQLLAGRRPLVRIIPADLPAFEPAAGSSQRALALPYEHYSDTDLAHRVAYVEASRGCPFKCEFCLSSLDVPVRQARLDDFLAAMERLLSRGLRRFKFVDRTFNLNLHVSRAILDFFRDRLCPGLFLHFEMIPDRLPEALRGPIKGFPPGALQFEVGIQSFDEEVCRRISRRQDAARVEDNLRFLREETGVHVHADLIVGLPGEGLDSFASGFDRLVRLGPQEIQIGMLKRLRGTPIARHDAEWNMVYSPFPPYEVLQTSAVDFATMQRLRRFTKYWDMVANSGNFVGAAPRLWDAPHSSPFRTFLQFSDWLFQKVGRNHSISLPNLTEFLFEYLTTESGQPVADVAAVLWRDYRAGGRRDGPDFLRPFIPEDDRGPTRNTISVRGTPARQARHLQGNA